MIENKSSESLNVLLVVGNRSAQSTTRTVVNHLGNLMSQRDCVVNHFDYAEENLPLFDVQTAFSGEIYTSLKQRVKAADVIVLGTPDYHGSMSSALKNFLDHFWTEFAGKLFGAIVGSHEKGLTVQDQMRTVMRQCYGWSLPYGVSFQDKTDVDGEAVISDALKSKLEGMVRDLFVYGNLLAQQRQADLKGTEPGFLAHYRK
ncbi:MAG: NAD(P)H-dependent oxidoreductase [Verrucomicrobia bacterium]|jgi:azobenzene reductase|nr:NAD(P)H-dependent oxidoreductase [Verrucomicrobiota bacterium]